MTYEQNNTYKKEFERRKNKMIRYIVSEEEAKVLEQFAGLERENTLLKKLVRGE